MLKRRIQWGAMVAGLLLLAGSGAAAQEIKKTDCFYLDSLHFTANGMAHWYAAENGGLESLTGVPYDALGCKNCHISGCDTCHRSESTRKDCQVASYSVKEATNQTKCLKCHGREKAMIGIDHKAGQDDVHIAQGMVCTDCHSAREMHGDGTPYISLKQDGAMDTRCEDCHDSLLPTEAHTVHDGQVDCQACHLRHVVSCTNCHFDTMVRDGKRVARPVSGWLFLMNYRGKVSSASMQTFVTGGDKTFLMFAPHMSHSVMNPGRACEACHATENVQKIQKGKIRLTWLEGEGPTNQKGVIPVVDGVEYQCAYEDRVNGNWVPIKNPQKPMIQYVGYGQPLSQEQLKKLAAKQTAPPPKME